MGWFGWFYSGVCVIAAYRLRDIETLFIIAVIIAAANVLSFGIVYFKYDDPLKVPYSLTLINAFSTFTGGVLLMISVFV